MAAADAPPLEQALTRHPHARAVLLPALPPAGAPSHAYLFHGPAGSGKAATARAFAAALLAEGADDPAAVAARVQRGAHPDLTWVTPSGAAEMLVADVDEPVVAAATRTPFEAQRRVFVIERAETLNDQAANRMLKTLEEPPAFAHLILLVRRPQDLLPTIASRCLAVRFDAPPSEEIAALLRAQGVDAARADACARLALGDVEEALRLASPEGEELRSAAEGFVGAALGGGAAALADRAASGSFAALLERARGAGESARAELARRGESELELIPSKERRRAQREAGEAEARVERRERTRALDAGLRLAGLWLRDLWSLSLGASEAVHALDRRAELARDADGRDPVALLQALELVEDTRRRLPLNVSEDLALEALAHRLRRTLAAA